MSGLVQAPLFVDAHLSLTGPAGDAVLLGRGSALALRVAQLSSLRAMLRIVGFQSARRRREWVARLDGTLRGAGLTLRIMVRERELALLGANAKPGLVSTVLRLRPVQVRLGGLLHSLLGS